MARSPIALVAIAALSCAGTVGAFALRFEPSNGAHVRAAGREPIGSIELASTLPLPGPPVDLAVGRTRVAVSTALAGVVLVRRSDGRIVRHVSVDGAATSITADDRRFWLVDLFGGRVLELDEAGAVMGGFAVGDLPGGIALSRSDVWVLGLADAQITVADRYGQLAPVRLQFPRDELWPGAIASAPDGIWIATGHRTTVTLLDPDRYIVRGQAAVPGVNLLAVTAGGVWAARQGDGPELVRVDGATFAADPIDLPGSAVVTALAGGTNLVVARRGAILVLDPATGEIRAHRPVAIDRELVQVAFDGTDLWALDAAREELLRFRVRVPGTSPVGVLAGRNRNGAARTDGSEPTRKEEQ